LMFFGNLRVVGVNEGNYELLIEKLMNFKWKTLKLWRKV
jgi:hypothetical protein